jgi:hypothetical protein
MLVVVDGVVEDEEARRQVSSDPERYVKIDPASSREQYRWMERFVASVEEEPLRERLLVSIDGKGAFRRFKDVLLTFPVERERWFTFRSELLHFHINQWFEAKGLTPDPPSPWGEITLPPEPERALERPAGAGQGPTDLLRTQVKGLVDMLPACELHSARAFLEYLRDRGTAELLGSRKPDNNHPQLSGESEEDEDEDEEPLSIRGGTELAPESMT